MSRPRSRFVLPLRTALPVLWALLCLARGAAAEGDLASIRRLLDDPSPRTRAAALRRLAGRQDRPALRLLVEALDDPHPYARRAAAGVLGALDEPLHRRLARDLGRLRAPRARVAATRIAALWGGETGRALLLDFLGDRDGLVREAAVARLADDSSEAASEALRRALDDSAGGVRARALDALRGRDGAGPPSPDLLQDPDFRVRLSALESSVALGTPSAGGEAAVVAVLRGLDDAVWSVRLRAAELAGAVRNRRLLAPLVAALGDGRQRVADAAHAALVALTGIPFDPDPEVWTGWLEGDGRAFDPQAEDRRPVPTHQGGSRTVAAPRFLDLPLPSRHIAFVIDASGSMKRRGPDGRTRWARVRQALATALEGLGRDACVNVVRFADEAEAAFAETRRLSASNRRALDAWLAEAVPAGRTALFDGIALALADPDVDTVVLLSDGAPSTGRFFTRTDLLTEVARANRWRRACIDVVDVGDDGIAKRWRSALRRLAEASGGSYRRS